jgi:dTDP-4-amino-4,6-dideoxygalactose transaminase
MVVSFGTITISQKAKDLIYKVLDEGSVTNGRLVKEFEEKFAAWTRAKYAIAVSSGTDAITISLAALHDYGALRGKEVVIPALTFIATANAVIHAGFEPVFIDVKKETLNIDETKIDAKMNRAVCAILPVHLMGKPADVREIFRIAYKWNTAMIEDCAEAHGAMVDSFKVGSFGIAACYSLYAAHIISSIEGGMITTNNAQFADICRMLRNHGRNIESNNRRFIHDRIGYSSKMNELEAAVGIGSIEMADEIVEKRRENFYALERGLADVEEIYTIHEGEHEKIGPHAFPMIFTKHRGAEERDKFATYLADCGIDSRTIFQCIPTQSIAFQFYNYGTDNKPDVYPNAEYISDNGIHIGVHQDMGPQETGYVVESVKRYFGD